VASWRSTAAKTIFGSGSPAFKYDKVPTMKWIVSDSEHLGGKPRVRDTRIAVALLLEWLASGMTIAEIVKEYPSLTDEAIRGTLEELAHSDLLTHSENPFRREHA